MDQIKISKFIAELRKQQNMTQSDLAEKLNVSNRAVSKWETGKSLPDPGIMQELCLYLKTNVNELLSGERISTDDYSTKAEENLIALSRPSSKRSSGYGITSILTLIFVVLKMTNNIDWSWIYVFSPIWFFLIVACISDNKLHAFLENASRWMKTRHKYGRMKAHGMRPAFYAATSARNKLVFALPLNHKLSMP